MKKRHAHNFIKNSLKNDLGFTLIEILIVVAIIGVLTTVGIASYNNFNERRIIEKAASDLKLYIRLAASKAMNNEKDCSVCGGADDNCTTNDGDLSLDGWYIDFSTSPPEIYGECGGTEFSRSPIGIPETMTIITNLPIDEICFYPLGEGTDLPSALTISIEGSPALTVDPSGNVY